MDNPKTIRWKQRYENLHNSFLTLQKAVEIDNPSEVERAGLIQLFEISFELSWKTLKDRLEAEGFSVGSPRETIKQAAQYGLLESADIWLEALENRNFSTHVYDEKMSKHLTQAIKEKYFPLIELLVKKLEV